ncbi:MAG: hypothetical protein ACETWE_08690 [Candidatus Bathyarchaeia archaeon]
MGSVLTGSDAEHLQMIGEYASGCSMHKVAVALNRSTATVTSHLHRYDNAVQRGGFCPCANGREENTSSLRCCGLRKDEYVSQTQTQSDGS